MFKKIGLVTVLVAGLAACSSDPVAVESATESKPASTASTSPTPTEPAPASSTAPTATTPPSSVAPTTAPATTAPPTSEPEVATSPPPATAPIGDLEVLTATGVGDPLSEPALIEQLDSHGFTADAPGNYAYYANPTPHPFVNIENGRLMDISVSRGVSELYSYTFAVDLPADQTLEALATAAAAPLVAKFPDRTAEAGMIDYGGQEAFRIELKSTQDYGLWTVVAVASAEYPTVAFVDVWYSIYNFGPEAATPEAPTGLTLVSPPFLPKVESTLEQANLPSANISTYDHQIGSYFNSAVGLDWRDYHVIDVEMDEDFATTARRLTALENSGWETVEVSDGDVMYKKDGDYITLGDTDDEDDPTDDDDPMIVVISLNPT